MEKNKHFAFLFWIAITMILTSCNPVTPNSVTPSSPYAPTSLFPPTVRSTVPPSTEQTGVRIEGHVALSDGSSLANVEVYLSLAAYSGERIALTDADGNFQSELKFIPGDENVTVWAELEGYTFNPPNFHWRHYHGLEERTLNFTAVSSSSISSTQFNSDGYKAKVIELRGQLQQRNLTKKPVM